jgi:outer membrane protein X
MKRFFIFTASLILCQFALAQKGNSNERNFKKFKTDVSIGYAIPQGSGTKGGVLFVIEPKYAVLDQLSVGLRMEAAVTANIDINGNTGSAKANASYLLTGDYYFSNNKFRPFGGAGGGIFTTASVDQNTTATSVSTIPTSSKFGFMARLGFEYGHFRMGAEYNFVADKAGYLGIKIGVCIGGGRK